MSDTTDTDVIVVGLGVGGETVASTLLDDGLSVVGIDSHLVGGECPYYGCIPSKMAIRAADLLAETRRVGGVAGSSTVDPDWAPVAERIRDEATDDWDDRVAVDRLVDAGGVFVRGRATFVEAGVVDVAGDRYRARRGIVVATGTDPFVPPIDGIDGVDYWTNRDALSATQLPASIIVLGGGAIGAELAQVYTRFGVDVSIVEAEDRLLPHEEPEAGELLREVFDAEGIEIHVGATATAASCAGELTSLALDDGTELSAERLLVAVGRSTDLEALGVDAVGLDPSARFVEVDERLRAGDGLWAVGDITGKGLFTHVAVYQARIAAADIAGRDHAPADYRALPKVTFTDPEVASVGLSEAEATERGLTVGVATAQVPSTARGWLHGPGNEGFIKVVADTDAGVLVGATSVGPRGGEVLAPLTLAIHLRTAVRDLREMIYPYPTFHRGIEDALRGL